MADNHAARPIYESHYYVNPHINKIRNGFAPLMNCNLCYEFFNAERNPRITDDGRTFCCLCFKKILNAPADVVNTFHPLNISYVEGIVKFKGILEMLYSRESTTYCELERAVYKKNNCISQLKSPDEVCSQRAFLVEELAAYSKRIIVANYVRYALIYDALKAAENCKNGCSLNNFVQNLSKILVVIKALGPSLDMVPALGGEDQWLLWNLDVGSGIGLKAKNIAKKEAPESFVSKVLDTYAFIAVDGVNRFSILDSLDTGLIMSTFVRKFPPYSRLGIAEFVLYDIESLTHVYSVYFEIVIAKSVGSEEEGVTLACRFNIDLAIPNICVNIAYSFLGTEKLCFMGAEIEVTNELIIFDSFNQNGEIVPANLHMPPSWTICRGSVNVTEGMALLTIKEQTTKLIIFKYSSVETNVVLYGKLNTIAMEALRRVPLGRHRIIGCGIEIRFNENYSQENKN